MVGKRMIIWCDGFRTVAWFIGPGHWSTLVGLIGVQVAEFALHRTDVVWVIFSFAKSKEVVYAEVGNTCRLRMPCFCQFRY